jgi:co-chaperonin GroES (HSP10)
MAGEAVNIPARNRAEAAKNKDKVYIEVGENRVIINDAIALDIVMGDNIMILEDQFKSGYECRECDGVGTKIVSCLKCEGSGEGGVDNTGMIPCGLCDGKGSREVSCKFCNGKGATLEVPESSKSRPTSGTIVACGPDARTLVLGERVAYSGHTGHLLPFKGNNRLRIMREREPFCRITTLKDQESESSKIEFIDKDNPYDLQ